MPTSKVPTRDRIKAAALELFSTQSYGTTTLQDIADKLGLTKAALYYYFKTKDELLEEVSGPFLDGFELIVVREETRPRTSQTPETLLLAFVEHLLAKRELVMLLCFDRSVQGHPVKQRTHDLLDRVGDLLAGPAPDQERKIQASAAIGAVILPVLRLPEEAPSPQSAATTITNAALATLAQAHAPSL
ncbi:TetR/AcrR family transcriptional regulator [Amycolatopsis sp. NPDC049253]|uniref:TetR/AcrR family transcriptional regulator n=1 Tax=Amycolatopsis sp. NPDC049253 TaxID=3155274 RepID=UPI0034372946